MKKIKRTITVLENKDFDYVPEEVVYESDDHYLISTGCDIINLSSTPLSSASYMLDIKTANGVSSSVYKISENEYRAICFNGTDNDKEYVFLNENNEITGKVIVKAHSLITVNPFDN